MQQIRAGGDCSWDAATIMTCKSTMDGCAALLNILTKIMTKEMLWVLENKKFFTLVWWKEQIQSNYSLKSKYAGSVMIEWCDTELWHHQQPLWLLRQRRPTIPYMLTSGCYFWRIWTYGRALQLGHHQDFLLSLASSWTCTGHLWLGMDDAFDEVVTRTTTEAMSSLKGQIFISQISWLWDACWYHPIWFG